uniref:Uncharacterized protein n=1 Tax=Arundo donax TaxID=35708 RepID=A0A0A9F2T9_ARUDO
MLYFIKVWHHLFCKCHCCSWVIGSSVWIGRI